MNSDADRPESPSYDERGSSNDECTRPNDIAGPHYMSTCTLQSLEQLRELCRIPPGIMAESMLPDPTESPENHRSGYFCVYEIYFKGCGFTFPLPEALVRYLEALEIVLPQLTPNLLQTFLGIITVAAEAGYVIGVPELNELLSVRSSSKKTGYFSASPNANRNLISQLPNKDENWHHPWFLIKKTPASIGNLSEVLPSKWSAKPDNPRRGNPYQLHRLPPPPSTQGMSARALAAKRKVLSKPITEACEENKEFLATAIDKKDYSRTLLVNDGSAEGARSAGAFRSTPRRERRGDRSPRKTRSPRHDSPRPSSRDEFSSEPLKNLIRQKRDKSSRSSSSPQREKSRARTDRSPRSSPPTQPMAPPPPVDTSSSSQPGGEKNVRSASPQNEGTESRGAPPKSKVVLVPQSKSLSGAILPNFDKWRPAIRERFLLHMYHSSQANSELNDMVEHYEGQLLNREQEIATWKGKLSALEADLRSSSGYKHELEDQVDSLTSELAKIKVKLRDFELAKSASKARKEVKGRGMELIQGAIRFIQTERARSELESDIKEHESNLLLLDQIHDKDFSEEQERSELTANLSEKRSRFTALPASSFNPQHFEEFIIESPPLGESGLDWAGSSEPENVAPSEVPAIPVTTSDGDRAVGNGPGTSSQQAPAKDSKETSPTEVEPEMAADPPLFLSGDGFEPASVLFPHAVFHFPSREKKEAYDFMDMVIDKHRRLCDERQRLGIKRQTLEARIARVERKVRALENDPFQWEWRNFDSIAEIPKMLRMYLRAKGMEFNLRCSESMPDFSRVEMMDGDVPNAPSRRLSPPRGFFKSQIQTPCALIKDTGS
ncbi:hypothetical protein ISN44_As07g009240 [Arabidopsis suecica]|uniref:Myosin heavy chain-like protein n=1 Tax=Arabidopsis suecica TaxID=45249 RepID=A0A8T2BRG0_ARASU|nr:hypothetical protein ISN44_As07g009240 [Arabidopsis suecica]